MRLATAILMYSFGGLRRDGAKEGETLPPGVTEPELLSVCVGPDLDSTTALACLKELREQCLYLHFDGARYCFKKDPNVTLLIEQEADIVARNDKRVRGRIKEMIEERLAGHHSAIVWPEDSGYVDDKEPSFLFAYLPLDFAGEPRGTQESTAKDFLENHGDKPRTYRNGLAIVVPSADQVEILRRAVRYLIAEEDIKKKSKQLNLTDEQKDQLKERTATDQATAESALLKLYAEVWLPRVESGGLGLEKVAAGGRPLQTTLNDKKQAMIHERTLELITSVQKRVFPSLKPGKLVELFKLGEGKPPTVGITTTEVVDGMYSFLGFTRLLESMALQKTIADGIQEGHFRYFSGPRPELGPDGRFQVALAKVRFKPDAAVPVDEIDLESGFLMLPQAIPEPTPPVVCAKCGKSPCQCAQPPQPCPKCGKHPCECAQPPVCPKCGQQPCVCTVPPPPKRETVEISFSADRNALFTAWKAIANLADMAGTVNVTVKAESEAGFDKSKLNNGVMEPLREADLIQ
jgi:hypothetical protein